MVSVKCRSLSTVCQAFPGAVTTRRSIGAVDVRVEAVVGNCDRQTHATHTVIVLGSPVPARALQAITQSLASLQVAIHSIRQTAHYPLSCFKLLVDDTHSKVADDALRAALTDATATEAVDVVITPTHRARTAKRLVMFDVDSTLVQGETIDMLATRAGVEAEVREITAATMRGEIDFAESLEQRVAMLAGLDESAVNEVASRIQLTPGARTTIHTLRRFGYHCGVVTGGFAQVIERLVGDLRLDYVLANNLQIVDGRLTGRVTGNIIDRPAKAAALREFAAAAGVPMPQTVAVGDGANDLDMLNVAGLGIAFNAKPLLREVADASLSFPYLDAVLLVLGFSSEQVAAANRIEAQRH